MIGSQARRYPRAGRMPRRHDGDSGHRMGEGPSPGELSASLSGPLRSGRKDGMRLGSKCLGMTVLLCGASIPLAEAARPVVAVFDIESRGAGLTTSQSNILADYVASRLASSGRFAVVPRTEVKRALGLQSKKSGGACHKGSCLIEVGKALAAEKTMTIRISKIGSRCTVSLKLFDFRNSIVEARKSVKSKCDHDSLVDALVKALKGVLGSKKVPDGTIVRWSPSKEDVKRKLARTRAEEAQKRTEKALRKEASKRWPAIRRYAQAKRLNKKKRIQKLESFIARYGENNAHRSEAEALLQKLQPGGVMVLVPAGKFYMSCDKRIHSECGSKVKPLKEVYLAAFRIDKTEVSVAQYKKCVDAGKCRKPMTGEYFNWDRADRRNHPINGVSWHDAKAYCEWSGKRLPTDKEWEKAARGTDGRKYAWGNQKVSCKYAVLRVEGVGCGERSTWAVGSKTAGASPYGALDMIGNVWEWTAGRYSKGGYRGARGSSWKYPPRRAEISIRRWFKPDDRMSDVGFRCSSQN